MDLLGSRLAGHVAVITGAQGGLGHHRADFLLQDGRFERALRRGVHLALDVRVLVEALAAGLGGQGARVDDLLDQHRIQCLRRQAARLFRQALRDGGHVAHADRLAIDLRHDRIGGGG